MGPRKEMGAGLSGVTELGGGGRGARDLRKKGGRQKKQLAADISTQRALRPQWRREVNGRQRGSRPEKSQKAAKTRPKSIREANSKKPRMDGGDCASARTRQSNRSSPAVIRVYCSWGSWTSSRAARNIKNSEIKTLEVLNRAGRRINPWSGATAVQEKHCVGSLKKS